MYIITMILMVVVIFRNLATRRDEKDEEDDLDLETIEEMAESFREQVVFLIDQSGVMDEYERGLQQRAALRSFSQGYMGSAWASYRRQRKSLDSAIQSEMIEFFDNPPLVEYCREAYPDLYNFFAVVKAQTTAGTDINIREFDTDEDNGTDEGREERESEED